MGNFSPSHKNRTMLLTINHYRRNILKLISKNIRSRNAPLQFHLSTPNLSIEIPYIITGQSHKSYDSELSDESCYQHTYILSHHFSSEVTSLASSNWKQENVHFDFLPFIRTALPNIPSAMQPAEISKPGSMHLTRSSFHEAETAINPLILGSTRISFLHSLYPVLHMLAIIIKAYSTGSPKDFL
jgi:hypothetical protein